MPALRFFGNKRRRLEYDADSEQVVDFLERNLFTLHFRPDRIDAFDPSGNFKVVTAFLQPFDDRGIEFFDETGPVGLRFVQFAFDFEILFRESVFQAEVL